MRPPYRTGYPARRIGLGAAAMIESSVPTPNVDAARYIEGRRFFYIYQTPNIASIANGVTTTNVIQFDVDSVFCWTRFNVFTDLAGAAITSGARILPLVTLQITDTGSGTSFFSNPVPLPTICGDAGLPFVLTSPQMIAPSSSLQFAFSNYSAGTTYANLRLQLIGFKVYGSQPPAQFGG